MSVVLGLSPASPPFWSPCTAARIWVARGSGVWHPRSLPSLLRGLPVMFEPPHRLVSSHAAAASVPTYVALPPLVAFGAAQDVLHSSLSGCFSRDWSHHSTSDFLLEISTPPERSQPNRRRKCGQLISACQSLGVEQRAFT